LQAGGIGFERIRIGQEIDVGEGEIALLVPESANKQIKRGKNEENDNKDKKRNQPNPV
jgi:hypothetical protein